MNKNIDIIKEKRRKMMENKQWTKEEQIIKTKENKMKKSEIINLAKRIMEDARVNKRMEEQLCLLCMYKEVGAFQAITSSNCTKCGKKIKNPTTDTDSLCRTCAKETNSCRHCGGEIDYI